MSIVAKKDIRRGEEILVCYNYSLHSAPDWYTDLYFQHQRYHEGRTEDYIYALAKRITREFGTRIQVGFSLGPREPSCHRYYFQVPPPHPNCHRFSPCGVCRAHVGGDAFCILCSHCDTWHHVKCLPEEVNFETLTFIYWLSLLILIQDQQLAQKIGHDPSDSAHISWTCIPCQNLKKNAL